MKEEEEKEDEDDGVEMIGKATTCMRIVTPRFDLKSTFYLA
jgi:hypothetical protein